MGRAIERMGERSAAVGKDRAVAQLVDASCAALEASIQSEDETSVGKEVMFLAGLFTGTLTDSVSDKVAPSSPPLVKMLDAIVASPMKLLTPQVAMSAVAAWNWICAAASHRGPVEVRTSPPSRGPDDCTRKCSAKRSIYKFGPPE